MHVEKAIHSNEAIEQTQAIKQLNNNNKHSCGWSFVENGVKIPH